MGAVRPTVGKRSFADTLEKLLAQRARRSVAGAAIEWRGSEQIVVTGPELCVGVEPRRRRARDSVDAAHARARLDGTPQA